MKGLKHFLQGRWLGHPLHPALVHVPVAGFVTVLIFDVLSQFGQGNNAFVQISFYAIALGLLAVLAVVPAGLADWWDIKPGRPARTLGLAHMLFNLGSTALWLINLILRWNTYQQVASVETIPLLLSLAATALLMVGGYLGGRLVYEHGISVVRQPKARAHWRRLAELGRARVPAEAPAEE